MKIEEIWSELEAETGSDAGWLTRLARPQTGYPLLVALERATRTRAILLPVSKKDLPHRREWPECRGVEVAAMPLEAKHHLCIRLREPAFAEVFAALVEDLAPRVGACSDGRRASALLMDRMHLWQKLLKPGGPGLSLEDQKGLWGELYTLLAHLLPGYGASVAVASWKGRAAAHQDFQFPDGAVEVKTTAAKQPLSIRITSERQLDDTGVGSLFLHVLVVDEREVPPGDDGPGQSLLGIISTIRKELSGEATMLALFNDRLLEAGWLDAMAPRYESRRWTLRSEHTYRVTGGFPRITESGVAPGIGDVSYAISLHSCAAFEVPQDALYSQAARDDLAL
jgi:hypothetical protein